MELGSIVGEVAPSTWDSNLAKKTTSFLAKMFKPLAGLLSTTRKK